MATRRARCQQLIRRYYADVPTREMVLDDIVLGLLRSEHVLLDAGCGSTLALLNQYAPKVAFAVGLDVITAYERPRGRGAVAVGDLARTPFLDGAFDVIVSRSVVEHLERPVDVFAEVARTLKPGGYLVFTTPNKYYYSSLVAWSIPYNWKDRFMRWVFGDESYDHFPVRYRANSRRALRRVAAAAGLEIVRLQALRHFPFYFVFSPVLFRLGMIYDWVVTRLRLDGLQSTWVVVMRKPGGFATDHSDRRCVS